MKHRPSKLFLRFSARALGHTRRVAPRLLHLGHRSLYEDAASTSNTLYLESLYTQYQADPSKLDVPQRESFEENSSFEAKWNDYFAAMELGQKAEPPAVGSSLRQL